MCSSKGGYAKAPAQARLPIFMSKSRHSLACCLQGHCYRSRTGKLERWYKPKWLDLEYLPSAPADLTAIHDSLVGAVVKRLMSDAPLGVLLSGGLDSSLVAAIAVRCACYVRPQFAHCIKGCCMRLALQSKQRDTCCNSFKLIKYCTLSRVSKEEEVA